MTSNRYKQFEVGQKVLINRGSAKGTTGTVLGQHPLEGTVEIDVDGTSVFSSNGNVIWAEAQQPVAQPVPNAKPARNRKPTLAQIESVVGESTEGAVTETTDTKEPRLCICGCGKEISKKAKGFRSGHDQAHKGNLIALMVGGGEQAEWAENELRRLNWRSDAQIAELKRAAKPKAIPVPVS
jgi:hypothetical protein